MGRVGNDISGALKLEIFRLAKEGKTAYRISKIIPVTKKTASKWMQPDRLKEIEKSNYFGAKRKGVVGRKKKFSKEEVGKLLDELEKPKMTQKKVAKKAGCTRKTLRGATRFDSKLNPDGAYPYVEKSCPEFTPRIQKQSVDFVKMSPIAKAAQKSKKLWDREKRKWGFIDHSPCSMSGSVNRTHRPQWLRKKKKKTQGLGARKKAQKMAAKHQAFTAICWGGKMIEVHSRRRRKKRKGAHIKPEYRLEKVKVNTPKVVRVIREKLGPFFKRKGVTIVFADNDKKLQSKAAKEEWSRWGIELYPGAGAVTNSAKGGFPVNRPALMPLDQSVHAAWKTHEGGLYDRWNSRRKERRTPGGFMNELETSWADLSMQKIRSAIDIQRKINLSILASNGQMTKYDTD